MPLAPEYQAMLDQLADAPGPAISEMNPTEARELYRMMRPANPELAVGQVTDRSIPGAEGDILTVKVGGTEVGTITLDATLGGDLNLDDRDGDDLSSVAEGGLVEVFAADGSLILSGTLQPK